MAEALGKATAIQKRNNLEYDDSEKQNSEEFAAAFGSAGGQALVEQLSGTFGGERNALAADMIESAVLNGMIESDQAMTFAKVLANELGDPGLVRRLSGTLQGIQSPDYNRTQAAMSVAERRDNKISQDSLIGKNGGIKSVGATIGAAGAALADFATVAAVAEEDYADGIISYKEYIEALNIATEAQSKYSDMLNQAVQSGENSATTKRAVNSLLGTQGLSNEEVDNLTQRLEDSFIESAEGNGKRVDEGNFFTDKMEDLGLLNKQEMAAREKELREGDNPSLGRESLIGQGEFDVAITESKALFGILNAELGDAAAAEAVVVELMNEQSSATKAYINTLRNTEDQVAAVNAALAMLALQGTDSLLNDSKYSNTFTEGFGLKGVNPQLLQNMLAQGQTEKQIQKQLAMSSGGFSFREQTGPGGEGTTTNFAAPEVSVPGIERPGGSLTSKQRAEYINAMGSVAELIGADMQETLTPFVAESIAAGVVDGGTEGIAELNEVLGGDQEALNLYLNLDIEDGQLDQATKIAEQLRYIKNEIPPNMMIEFGIDIKNPEDTEKLMDPLLVDRLSSISKMMESVPEEEISFAAKFAFDIDDPNGKPLTTAEFLTGWRDVRQELADLDGASSEVTMTAIIDILTKVNDQPVTPEQAETAMDKLVKQYGVDTIRNLPPITLATVLDIEIDTALAVEKLRKASTVMQSGTSGLEALDNQITALQALGDNKVGEEVAPKAFNGSPSDGGGGGGGDKDKNWIEQLQEDYKKENEIMGNMKKLAEHNLKEAKQINKINEEVMRFIAQDDEAMKDFNSGKFSAKDINKMYFGNMAKGENAQTKDMRKSSRREDLVKSAKNMNFFTQQQLLADEELLQMYEKGGKFRKQAVEDAEKRAKIETTELDKEERKLDLMREQNDLAVKSLELAIKKSEASAEDGVFAGTGKDRASVDQRQKEIAAEINLIQLQSIGPIKDKIELQKRLIKETEREYAVNEDNVDALKDQASAQRRIVEDMQRALEIRQREGAVLTHDLKLMGYMEEDINEAYDKRMEALDKTLTINQQIAQSQQQQLGLASALSRGDVSAAASAAQQMQQGAMENAANQFKSQLETSRDSQINSLTGADSGMTKDQITERQRQLEEESYYTNLQIRDIEDEIWGINRNIRNEQDIINGYKDSIKENNRTIKDLEWEIYEAEQAQLTTLKDEQKENNILLAQADLAVVKADANDKIALARFERSTAMWEQEQEFAIAKIKLEEELGKQMASNFSALKQMTKMANEYHKAISSGKGSTNIKMPTMKVSDLSMKYVSKSMEDFTMKLNDAGSSYGDKTASFNLPSASVGAKATSGIMGNVTNNNMNNNVNVNAQGANAMEVADIVIRKLDMEKFKNIGGAG
jgi:hypothetical protein